MVAVATRRRYAARPELFRSAWNAIAERSAWGLGAKPLGASHFFFDSPCRRSTHGLAHMPRMPTERNMRSSSPPRRRRRRLKPTLAQVLTTVLVVCHVAISCAGFGYDSGASGRSGCGRHGCLLRVPTSCHSACRLPGSTHEIPQSNRRQVPNLQRGSVRNVEPVRWSEIRVNEVAS